MKWQQWLIIDAVDCCCCRPADGRVGEVKRDGELLLSEFPRNCGNGRSLREDGGAFVAHYFFFIFSCNPSTFLALSYFWRTFFSVLSSSGSAELMRRITSVRRKIDRRRRRFLTQEEACLHVQSLECECRLNPSFDPCSYDSSTCIVPCSD